MEHPAGPRQGGLEDSRQAAGPDPVAADSRGILHPWLLQQRLQLTRYPVGPVLAGLVDRFWAVSWDLPAGTEHRQQVLTHPGANISVGHGEPIATGGGAGPLEARLSGVAKRLTTRVLAGRGWAVAAMTTPGGLAAFVPGPVSTWNDREVGLSEVLGLDEAALIDSLRSQPDAATRAEVLGHVLEGVLAGAEPERVRRAREVAEVARLAETDRSLRRLADLSARSGVGARSLQRMFAEYAGVSPTWVLRRYRLLDVAEQVRSGGPVSWPEVAADLGYADQAHLTRDFRAATGMTPAAYAQHQAALAGGGNT